MTRPLKRVCHDFEPRPHDRVTSIGMLVAGRVTVSPSLPTYGEEPTRKRMPIGRPLEGEVTGRVDEMLSDTRTAVSIAAGSVSPADMSARRLRVLIVHRYRSGQLSGENHVVDQESALLADAGHCVTRFERHSDDIASTSPLVKASVPLKVTWNAAVRAELTALLHKERPDVVHIYNTFPLVSPSTAAACADVDIPAVATLHNYCQVCPQGNLYRNGQICMDCVGKLPLRAPPRLLPQLQIGHPPRHSEYGSQPSPSVVGCDVLFCVSDPQTKILIQAGMPAQRLVVKRHFLPDPGIRRTRRVNMCSISAGWMKRRVCVS